MHLRRATLFTAVALACIAGAARACPEHASKSATALAPSASRVALLAWKPRAWSPAMTGSAISQGLRVSIDPVDGTMGMPSPDELPVGELRTEDGAPLAVFHRANGSVRATLDERFADFAVVRLNAEGKPEWTCVRGTHGAAQFLRSASSAPASLAPPSGTVWEEK